MIARANISSSTFLAVEDSRSRLNRVMIVRIGADLSDRVAAAIEGHPALVGMSRSEFTRRALVFALDSLGSAGDGR